MPTDPVWRWDGQRARLSFQSATCEVDAARPDLGVQHVAFHNAIVARPLWSLRPDDARKPLALHDAHVRGPDFIAAYAPNESFPFRTEVYWRAGALGEEGPLTLSLIVSVETDRLDARPALVLESRFAAVAQAEMDEPRSGGPVMRATESDVTLLEVTQPSDLASQHGAELECSEKECVTRWRLFDHFLEKGVIRRARLSLVMAAGEPTARQAAAWREAIRSQPAPLTA